MPYSDNPTSSYSDNPTHSRGGYRDKPDPPSTFDYETQDYGTPDNEEDDNISSIVSPPVGLFPFVGDINNSIINRSVSPTSDEEESVGDFVRSLGLDNVDDSDNNNTYINTNEGGLTNGAPASSNDFIWHLTPGSNGKEVDSIFVDGYDKSSTSNQQSYATKKIIKLALLGFAMGIIVMLVLLLVGTDTGNVDGGSSSRLGAPNDSGSSTTLLDGFDQSIDTSLNLDEDEDKPDEIIVAEEGEKDINQEEDDTHVQSSEKNDNQGLPETTAAKEDEADVKPQESEAATVEDVDKTNPPKEEEESIATASTTSESDDSNVPAHVHNEDLEEMSTAYTIAVENIHDDEESLSDTPTNVIQPKDPSEVQPPPPVTNNNNNDNEGDTNSNGSKYPYPDRTDVTEFCGGCRYKGSLFSCDQRVTYMKQRFGMTDDEAKIGIMKWGHCPDPTGQTPKPQVGPELSSSGEPLPTYGGCRKRYNPDLGNVLDNFCGHCEWKNSAYTCFKRALWLRDHYGQTHEQAMINLMNNGYCKDERSEDDMKRLKEWGLQDWCSYCTTNDGYTCHEKLAPTFWNPDQCHSTKIALLADGQCKLPPYCDEEEEEDTTTTEDSELSTDDDSVDSNPFLNCDFANP